MSNKEKRNFIIGIIIFFILAIASINFNTIGSMLDH